MINSDYLKTWIKAALIRAIKTACQTAVAMVPVEMAISEVSWGMVAGVSTTTAVISILTSIAGLPEVDNG